MSSSPTPMNLRHIRYFLAVAEERSFLRAAARLHISQPPLSAQIRDLEISLGVRLFDRTPQGTGLTQAGRVFYDEARAIVARIEHAKVTTQRAANGQVGSLAIGFISLADYGVLPPALRRFRAIAPAVDVQLHELTTDMQLRELAEHHIDLGIALAPVQGELLRFTELHAERLMIAVPAEHRLARMRAPLPLREFRDESYVMIPRVLAPGLHDLMLSFCGSCGFVPRITQYARQMQTVISLVSAGFGVALVPQSLQMLRRAGVTYLQLEDALPDIRIGIVHREDDHNPMIGAFLDCAREVARELPV